MFVPAKCSECQHLHLGFILQDNKCIHDSCPLDGYERPYEFRDVRDIPGLSEENIREAAQGAARMYTALLAGKTFKHFKGELYDVMHIGVHSETSELYVVYKTHGLTIGIWIRPLKMFLSEVDHKKYPDVKQKYRFEEMAEV